MMGMQHFNGQNGVECIGGEGMDTLHTYGLAFGCLDGFLVDG